MSRCYGTIKTTNPDKGYAFITTDHGPDAFVLFRSFEEAGMKHPQRGDRYSFDVQNGPRGLRAVNIGAE